MPLIENDLDNPLVTAHNVVRLMIKLHLEIPDVIARMQRVLVYVGDWYFNWHFGVLTRAINKLRPAFRTFLLAARRQNIISLPDFIGADVYWLEFMCYRVLIALDSCEEHLTTLEGLKQAMFIKQARLLLRFDSQLGIIRPGILR